MGEVNGYVPATVTFAANDECYRRVNAYLAALGVHREYQRHELVRRVLERAAEKIGSGETTAAVALSFEEIEQEIVAWLRRVLELSNTDDTEILLRGRLAMLLVDFPERWGSFFLAEPPLPDELVIAMRESYLKAVPHFYTGCMVDRPLDLGYIPRLAEVTLLTLEKTRWLRLILIWGGFIGAFALLFYYSR